MTRATRTYTTAEMAEQKRPRFELAHPYDLLGRLVACFYLVVYGIAGAGKSTWVLGLARALADLAPVLYISAEEEHGPTFADRVRRMGAAHDRLHVRPWVSIADVLEQVKQLGAQFVILDSATVVDSTSRQVHELWQALQQRGVALVVVGHVTTEGRLKGGTYLQHDCHIVVRVENGPEGGAVARTEKNRYAGLADAPVAFTVKQIEELSDRDGYGFTAYDRDGIVWATNGGAWEGNPAVRAAMFARLDESGERQSSRSRSRSGGRSSGGGAAGGSAPSSTAPTASSSAAPKGARQTVTLRVQETFAEAVRTGTLKHGRTRYAVDGVHVDPKGRPVLIGRDESDGVALAFAGTSGLVWQKGVSDATVSRLTPADLDTLFETDAPAADAPAKPKSRKTSAKKASTTKKSSPRTKTSTAAAVALDPRAAVLDESASALTRIEEMLATRVN